MFLIYLARRSRSYAATSNLPVSLSATYTDSPYKTQRMVHRLAVQ